MADRAAEENRLAASSPAIHDFLFTDRVQASGITFQNRVVDDAGKSYKLVHYDHGSGVCSADVDGDGLPDLYLVTISDHVSTPAEDEAREKEVNAYLQTSSRQQDARSGERARYRKLGGTMLLQELVYRK